MPLIDALLDEHGWDKSSLEAVAVSGGPGSFTGLRIGVSTAKGLCHGLGLPLIALDTLGILAAQGARLDPTPATSCRHGGRPTHGSLRRGF